jgi:hypothetical protein
MITRSQIDALVNEFGLRGALARISPIRRDRFEADAADYAFDLALAEYVPLSDEDEVERPRLRVIDGGGQ